MCPKRDLWTSKHIGTVSSPLLVTSATLGELKSHDQHAGLAETVLAQKREDQPAQRYRLTVVQTRHVPLVQMAKSSGMLPNRHNFVFVVHNKLSKPHTTPILAPNKDRVT